MNILVSFYHVAGIGDEIASLPFVWQLVQAGNRVTVNCESFYNPLWRCLNVAITNKHLSLGDAERIESQYDKIYTIGFWGEQSADSTLTHMEFISDRTGIPIPEEFSYRQTLKPIPLGKKPYVILALEATDRARALPESLSRELFERISEEREIVWLSRGSRAATDEQWAVTSALSPDMARRTFGITTYEELIAFRESEAVRLKRCTVLRSLDEIINYVANASHVVAAESGVAHIAGALGVPLTILHGPTGAARYAEQYKRFNPEWHYVAITGKPNDCTMPCYRKPERGFTEEKCGKSSHCLATIATQQILESLLVNKE